MGFSDEIADILYYINQQAYGYQNILVSASISGKLEELLEHIVKKPVEGEVAEVEEKVEYQKVEEEDEYADFFENEQYYEKLNEQVKEQVEDGVDINEVKLAAVEEKIEEGKTEEQIQKEKEEAEKL